MDSSCLVEGRTRRTPPPLKPKPKLRYGCSPTTSNDHSDADADGARATDASPVAYPARGTVKVLTERFEKVRSYSLELNGGCQRSSVSNVASDDVNAERCVRRQSSLNKGLVGSAVIADDGQSMSDDQLKTTTTSSSSTSSSFRSSISERRNGALTSSGRRNSRRQTDDVDVDVDDEVDATSTTTVNNSGPTLRSRSSDSVTTKRLMRRELELDSDSEKSKTLEQPRRRSVEPEAAAGADCRWRQQKTPPTVPPKPSKRTSSMGVNEYAEYDVLTRSPAVVRWSPNGHVGSRPLPETPTYDCLPQTPLPVVTTPTMDLLDDSQLNISGHIYCAVRNGVVIDDDGSPIANDVSGLGENNDNDDETSKPMADDDGSFSESVLSALGLLPGSALRNRTERPIEEDAVTNYEEIFEDLTTEVSNEYPDKSAEIVLSTTTNVTVVGSEKPITNWETCSSFTSTSAESNSSTQSPALIAYRQKPFDELNGSDDVDIKRAAEDASVAENGLPTTEERKETAGSQLALDDYVKRSFSPPVTQTEAIRPSTKDARHSRPRSQLDNAANSLWRFKSDIQLNLSQAMGKIKLKVSSTPTTADGAAEIAKKRDSKARSTFYLPPAAEVSQTTKSCVHPTISITLEAGLEEERTSASSDDEWELSDDEKQQDQPSTDPQRPSVLPDVVPDAKMKSVYKSSPRNTANRNTEENLGLSSSSPSITVTDVAAINTPSSLDHQEFPTTSSFSESTLCQQEMERFELVYNSRFAFSEPLYQHYRNETATVQRNQTFSEGDDKATLSRREQLLNASQLGSQRTLWCELPEVQKAGLLSSLSNNERKIQEAMFELITSEASYLRSLNILITQFMASPRMSGNASLGSCITKQERKHLFSNILTVRDCSERLLCALENRLAESVVLEDVCDVLYEHLRRDHDVYVKYCANQIYQERTLSELRRSNNDFRLVISQLEANPVCECLNLRSFLMLPMQRVTRYPLLVAAILNRLEEPSARQTTAQKAYAMSNRVVRQCNEGAKRLERIEQLIELDKAFMYKEGGPKRVAFVSGSRWLIKKGPLVHFQPRRHTLGVRGGVQNRRVFLFLFTDWLFITKPIDGDRRFVVKDYCSRQFVEVAALEPTCPQIPEGWSAPPNSHLVLFTLMKNHRGRQVEMIMSCDTETDKTRWLAAVRPAAHMTESETTEEKIYESWDCPQVRVLHEYQSLQEDELQLEVGEIINVLRKMPDGWFEGERLRDCEKGWFPSSHTEEILSDHIRAKNYRDRLRIINEAELLQRSICESGLPTTGNRRSSIIPTAAKALFRF